MYDANVFSSKLPQAEKPKVSPPVSIGNSKVGDVTDDMLKASTQKARRVNYSSPQLLIKGEHIINIPDLCQSKGY